MRFEDFKQLVLHGVLLPPGRCVLVSANKFRVFMPTGTPRDGARSNPMENDLLNFFFVLFN
jgi:hypothetical protein